MTQRSRSLKSDEAYKLSNKSYKTYKSYFMMSGNNMFVPECRAFYPDIILYNRGTTANLPTIEAGPPLSSSDAEKNLKPVGFEVK